MMPTIVIHSAQHELSYRHWFTAGSRKRVHFSNKEVTCSEVQESCLLSVSRQPLSVSVDYGRLTEARADLKHSLDSTV